MNGCYRFFPKRWKCETVKENVEGFQCEGCGQFLLPFSEAIRAASLRAFNKLAGFAFPVPAMS
jgi:hypothetical protein